MGNNIVLKQKETGLVKEAKLGFSFTSLFFGVIIPIIRGDFKGFVLQLLASMATFGFAWLVIPFLYNKRYVARLLEKGYVAADKNTHNMLVLKGLVVDED